VPLDDEERRRAYERSRLEMMRAYADLDECRRRFILNYFGEEPPDERCPMCDNDVREGGRRDEPAEDETAGLAVGERVRHDSWGDGVVQRVADGKITVLFDDVGYRTLAADVVLERGVLTPAAAEDGDV
jgi:ATP-dependent DNA helicase RecQ